MNLLLRGFILTLAVLCFSSCADYKLHIAPEAEDWEKDVPPTDIPVTHTMYLIGDSGNASLGGTKPALRYIKTFLDTASENSSVIFLGDNIYPVGMPPKYVPDYRELAEHKLNVQIETVKNFAGRPIFLPGNHDWGRYSVEGVRRQEKYVEKELAKIYGDKFKKEEFFLPNDACSGPEVIELNDQLVVIVIDSQWFLTDWDNHPGINDGCDIKNRDVFKFLLNDVVRKYRSKNCVIAMHHPIYNNGTHGGHYTWKQHLFPLTEKSDNLWIPFPIIGSVAQLIRATTGTRQDTPNGFYKEMIDAVVTPAKRSGEYIFAAGHDHNLQYFEADDQKFIVSGAGSKQSPAAPGNGSLMTYGKYGFSKIDFYEDGSAWIEFYVALGEGEEGRMIFRRKIKDALEISPENIPDEFPEYESEQETFKVKPITTETEKVGPLHKAVLGEHWREIYRREYDFPTLDLAEFQGGVKVLKRGGGNQTNSLRLEDAQGRQWTMRGLTKDASRFIPYPFNQLSSANFIVKDNFLSAHPFASVVIPPLAKASNIYHTNPKLYFIPKQPTLGVHNDVFGNEVYLVEERPQKDWSGQETFGKPDDVHGTYDVAERIKRGWKHKIDQNWTARTRLFDILIGDWDRHDDQWRWSETEEEDGMHWYRPIPRDRDQAWSKYDGAATAFARLYAPFLRQLVTYKDDLGNIKWASWSPRHFDAAFLNELSMEEWLREARFIQEAVTDELIEKAFREMPQTAYDLSAKELIPVMKRRRDNLEDIARRLYLHLAEEVTVIGSEKGDYFEIIREDNDKTIVRVYDRDKKGKKDEKMYERTFLHKETEEIFLYGLNGDDVFVVEGEVRKGLKINLIGGLDEDEFVDNGKVSGPLKKTHIYDNLEENSVDGGKETKDRRSAEAEENTYVRRGPMYEKNIASPLPVLKYNPDDGVLAGMAFTYNTFDFGKPYFSQKHFFSADYSLATQGVDATYRGEFYDVLKRWDFVGRANFTSSRHAINYFGFGNETVYLDADEEDLDFNRVRQGKIYADFGLQKRFAGKLGRFSVRPLIDFTNLENTPGRFAATEAADLDDSVFDWQRYAGGKFILSFKNTATQGDISKGMNFAASYQVQTNLERSNSTFTRLDLTWAMYFPLSSQDNLVLASRLGSSIMSGNFLFFQAPTLGGAGNIDGLVNLRGYRAERFRGNATFFHNLDLRLKLFNSKNSILPFTFGIHGGFDYGRVWADGENSDTWHTGYGGGVWIAPVNLVSLNFSHYRSAEDQRFVFRVGQAF